MFDYLRAAIRSAKDHDPAARNSFEILLLYPGLPTSFIRISAILLHG